MAEKSNLQFLISMGFNEASAKKALQDTNGNLELAIDMLSIEIKQNLFVESQNISCQTQNYKIIKDFAAGTKGKCPIYYLDESLRKKPGHPVSLMNVGNSIIVNRVPF